MVHSRTVPTSGLPRETKGNSVLVTRNRGSARRPSHSLERGSPIVEPLARDRKKLLEAGSSVPIQSFCLTIETRTKANFDQIAGDNVAPRDLRSKRWSVAPW